MKDRHGDIFDNLIQEIKGVELQNQWLSELRNLGASSLLLDGYLIFARALDGFLGDRTSVWMVLNKDEKPVHAAALIDNTYLDAEGVHSHEEFKEFYAGHTFIRWEQYLKQNPHALQTTHVGSKTPAYDTGVVLEIIKYFEQRFNVVKLWQCINIHKKCK